VTDTGLKELKEFKQLTLLDLGHTLVTDAGMKELKEFKHLAYLKLADTLVTDEGLKELKEALPRCEISRRP
jgi:internalin A